VNALKTQLADQGIDVAVLESDVLRRIFTPQPHYDEDERETFYRQIVYVGEILTQHGVPVIFDATANRRAYRSWARTRIPRFLEVYLDSALETCMARDPKGIYRQAREGGAASVPGLQSAYEPPENPDVVISGDKEDPATGAVRVRAKLAEKGFI
jgi:adenylylsulfate kinase-like enzyme